MIHNGDRLRALVVPGLAQYPLFSVKKAPMGFKTWDFVAPLVENNLVCGRGSKNSVRELEMLVEMDEADRILGENASRTRRERAKLPLDVLHRMCGDRKTTFIDRFTVIRHGRTVHVEVPRHKANARMLMRGEQDKLDAERKRFERERLSAA